MFSIFDHHAEEKKKKKERKKEEREKSDVTPKTLSSFPQPKLTRRYFDQCHSDKAGCSRSGRRDRMGVARDVAENHTIR